MVKTYPAFFYENFRALSALVAKKRIQCDADWQKEFHAD
jgi:hypothetical protein